MDTFPEYYRHQSDEFLKFAEQTKQHPDFENLHALRVTIKKIRAIRALSKGLLADSLNEKSLDRLCSPLFDAAGTLREIQVCRKMIPFANTPASDGFNAFLEMKENIYFKELTGVLSLFDKDLFIRENSRFINLLENISDVELSKYCIDFIYNHLKKALSKKHLKKDTSQLHKIRKLLKSAESIFELSQTLFPEKSLEDTGAHIRNTNQEIGKWHDLVVLKKVYSDFQKSGTRDETAATFEAVLKLRLKKHKKAVIASLKEL